MDKFFENMDKRFNSIETELDYNYTKDSWESAQNMLDDDFLDSSFIEAAEFSAVTPDINFESIDDAFLDDVFVDASSTAKASYTSQFFNDFKNNEENLVQNDSFVSASNASKASYQTEYWNDADIALQNEGLHHEYKAKYWAEAEKLLAKDKRKGFFWLWSSVATFLLLVSGIGLNFTTSNLSSNTTIDKEQYNTTERTEKQLQLKNEKINTNLTSALAVSTSEIEHTKQNNDNDNDKLKISSTTSSLPKLIESNTLLNRHSNKSIQNTPTNSASSVISKTVTSENLNKSNSSITHSTIKNIEDNDLESTTTTKIKSQKINLIALSNSINTPQTIEFPPALIKPKHLIGIKLEKGIGNVFTENKTTFSARDALYIDYRFVPAKKLRQFEFGFESGIYHMNLDNLEFEQNYSVYRNHGEVDYYWSKMTYEDLIFLSSSINIFYSINAKHKIKIAAGFDKLITSKIDMTYKSNFENPAESNNGEWGINKGINTLDFTFGMGYEFEINSKFSFVFDTKFGTLDKTNNDYLRNTKMNRDISLLLGLKYTIFEKR
jgi:hypothetical protein